MSDDEGITLTELLDGKPFAVMPMEMEFIGGPKDGTAENIPSSFLECRIGGHKYHMGLAKSNDPTVPFKYVLVSHTLMET